jgi:large subunit ribosomal protein L25
MKAAVEIPAETRQTTGKGAARAARRNGQVPVELYSKGRKNISLNVEARVLANEYFKGGFMNKLVALKAGDKSFFAVPRDIQLNPVSDKIEHADFLQVDEKSVVKVYVPLRFKNAEKSPGIKRGGVLNVVRHDIELYCPVNAIPAQIEVDIGALEIGQSVHVSKLDLPQGVTTVIKGRDFTIASVAGRQKEEEEVPSAAAAAATAAAATAAAGAAAPAGAAAGAAAPAADAKAPAGKK